MTTHGAGAWQQILLRRLHLVASGLLAGDYKWKALFVQPATQVEQSAASASFAASQFRRFRQLARVALVLLMLSALWDAARPVRCGVGWLIWADLLLVALLAAAIGKDVFLHREEQDPFAERPAAALVLALLLLSALVQAAFDVILAQGGGSRWR